MQQITMSLSRKLQQLRISAPRRRRLVLTDMDNENVQLMSNGSVFGLVEDGGLHRVEMITHTDFGNQSRVTLIGNGMAWNFDLYTTDLQKLKDFSPVAVA